MNTFRSIKNHIVKVESFLGNLAHAYGNVFVFDDKINRFTSTSKVALGFIFIFCK